MDIMRQKLKGCKETIVHGLSMLSPANIRKQIRELKLKTYPELFVGFFKLIFKLFYYVGYFNVYLIKLVEIKSCSFKSITYFKLFQRHFFRILLSLMRGPQPEKVAEKPVAEETTMLILRPPPPTPAILPPAAEPEHPPGTVALIGAPADGAAKDQQPADGSAPVTSSGPTDPANPDATAAAGGDPAAAGPPAKESLFVGSLIDPAEEAAKAAAAAEVQAQQEAAMAALDAKASSASQTGDAPAVGQVCTHELIYSHEPVIFLICKIN